MPPPTWHGKRLAILGDQLAVVALAHGCVEVNQLHQGIVLEAANPILEIVEGQLERFPSHQLHDPAAHQINRRNQHGSLTGTPCRANSCLSARTSAMPK